MSASFGGSEYEWAWLVAAEDLDRLRTALGGGKDILEAMVSRFSGEKADDIKAFFVAEEIAYTFWSRVGD